MSKNMQRNLLPRNFRHVGDNVIEDLFVSKEAPPQIELQFIKVELLGEAYPRLAEIAWKKFIMSQDESKPWFVPSTADITKDNLFTFGPDGGLANHPHAARIYAVYKLNDELFFQIMLTDSVGQAWADWKTWWEKHGPIPTMTMSFGGYTDEHGNLANEGKITACFLLSREKAGVGYTDYRTHMLVEKVELVKRTEPRELSKWMTTSDSKELYEQSLVWAEEDIRERQIREQLQEVPVMTTVYSEAAVDAVIERCFGLVPTITESTVDSRPVDEKALINRDIRKVHDTDCGSTETIDWEIRGETPGVESDLKALEGKYYYLDGDTELKRVSVNDTHLIGKRLRLRHVYGCVHSDANGICKVCFGGMPAAAMPSDLVVGMSALSVEDQLMEIESRLRNDVEQLIAVMEISETEFDPKLFFAQMHDLMLKLYTLHEAAAEKKAECKKEQQEEQT